ncbi:MAG: NAD(P)H-binding protein [Myxococcales bacterium]|nr:NAD(P)H-binding protein [Myxococcales bacterium]
MKILVIGGTGRLGEPVVRRLVADGHEARVLTRSREIAAERFGGLCEVVAGDVEDRAAVDRALVGCDAVYLSLDGHGDWDLERRGAELVAAAAKEAGLERIGTISGASVCEENTWFPMTRAKFLAERAIRESGVPYTIFRCTMFMELLPSLVRGDKALVMGEQVHPWRFLAAADYARMVSKALALPAAANRTLLIVGPEALTMEQALRTYRRLCAPDAELRHVPFFVLRLLSLFPGRRELRRVGLPIMRYFSKVHEIGSPDEANDLLGAPTTTVDQWCRSRRAFAHAA